MALQLASQRHEQTSNHLQPSSSMVPLHPRGPKTHFSMPTGTASPVWRPRTRERPGTVLAWSPAVPSTHPPLPTGLAARTELNGKHCKRPSRAGASPGCGQGWEQRLGLQAACAALAQQHGPGRSPWTGWWAWVLMEMAGVWRSLQVGQHHQDPQTWDPRKNCSATE